MDVSLSFTIRICPLSRQFRHRYQPVIAPRSAHPTILSFSQPGPYRRPTARHQSLLIATRDTARSLPVLTGDAGPPHLSATARALRSAAHTISCQSDTVGNPPDKGAAASATTTAAPHRSTESPSPPAVLGGACERCARASVLHDIGAVQASTGTAKR